MPKISLVMGVYNGETHLRESIESILVQTFTDFELIIVDDGSNDDTANIIAEYATKDSRVKVIANQINIGLTRSLNRGIEYAQGEYIARMDAGDTSEPSRFQEQVAFLDSHPEIGFLGSWAYIIDDSGKKIGEMKYVLDNKILKRELIKHNLFVHSSIMIRKMILDMYGAYNNEWKYAQDYELFLRLSQFTDIGNMPIFLVSYRISPVSITRKKNKQQTMYAIKARIQAIRRCQYSVFSYFYLIKPYIGYLLSYNLKLWLKGLR